MKTKYHAKRTWRNAKFVVCKLMYETPAKHYTDINGKSINLDYSKYVASH
jgi:hypothetical protein